MSTARLLAGTLDLRQLDTLAAGSSLVHRLDARAKLLVTLTFLVVVMSFPRDAVAPLLGFVVFPAVTLALAGLPAAWVLRKLLLVLPLALLIGLPNLVLERAPALQLGPWLLSEGTLTMTSIVLRALLAASAALVLVAVTGFNELCRALARLGVPQALVMQLMFLHRYLGVLADEALRMGAAHAQRSGGRGLPLRQYGVLAGRLLVRTWDRAERVHRAMCARGFSGTLPGGTPGRWGAAEWAWLALWMLALAALRGLDVAQALGTVLLRVLG